MLTYLFFSLGAGVLVGIIYSLINVRSPAPPLVALAGLLGMLVGEEVNPVGKQIVGRKSGAFRHLRHGRASRRNTRSALFRPTLLRQPRRFLNRQGAR